MDHMIEIKASTGVQPVPRHAFTLIELLVVIAIIALLMGILVPVLHRVRALGRSAACKANLHSWGLIWRLYANEHDGKFSPGDRVGWPRGDWVLSLRDYWKEKDQILLCPSATKRRVSNGRTVDYGSHVHAYVQGEGYDDHPPEVCSYGLNLWMFTLPPVYEDLQGRPASLHFGSIYAKNMADVPLFLDSMWRGGGPWYGDASGETGYPTFYGIRPPDFNGQWRTVDHEMMHFAMDRHSKGINGVFVDGSVRHIGIKGLWNLQWHKKYKASVGFVGDWPAWLSSYPEK